MVIQKKNGFTLLELLLIITVLSVLAIIAIPYYQDYTTKAKITEGVAQVGPFRSMITEYYLVQLAFPSDNSQLGVQTAPTTPVVQSVAVGSSPSPGSVIVTFKTSALPALGNQNTLVYVPSITGNNITWECRGGTMLRKYRPHSCID